MEIVKEFNQEQAQEIYNFLEKLIDSKYFRLNIHTKLINDLIFNQSNLYCIPSSKDYYAMEGAYNNQLLYILDKDNRNNFNDFIKKFSSITNCINNMNCLTNYNRLNNQEIYQTYCDKIKCAFIDSQEIINNLTFEDFQKNNIFMFFTLSFNETNKIIMHVINNCIYNLSKNNSKFKQHFDQHSEFFKYFDFEKIQNCLNCFYFTNASDIIDKYTKFIPTLFIDMNKFFYDESITFDTIQKDIDDFNYVLNLFDMIQSELNILKHGINNTYDIGLNIFIKQLETYLVNKNRKFAFQHNENNQIKYNISYHTTYQRQLNKIYKTLPEFDYRSELLNTTYVGSSSHRVSDTYYYLAELTFKFVKPLSSIIKKQFKIAIYNYFRDNNIISFDSFHFDDDGKITSPASMCYFKVPANSLKSINIDPIAVKMIQHKQKLRLNHTCNVA